MNEGMAQMERLLSGQHVRLWPYASTAFPRDTLYSVWRLMEKADAWRRVLYFSDSPSRGDLAHFALYMRDKIPILVQWRESRKLAGLIWFDEFYVGLRINMSIWFEKAAFGEAAEEAGRLATVYAHTALGVPWVWGVTPWKQAVAYALRCGWKLHTALPAFVRVEGIPRPMYYVCHYDPRLEVKLCPDSPSSPAASA